MKVIVTGGAGFIGSAVCRHLVGASRAGRSLNVDKLTYAANLASLKPIERAARLPLRAGRHLRPRRDRPRARRGRARRDHASCRREPRRPLDHRLGRVHRDQYRRHATRCSRPRAPTGAGCRRRAGRASASFTSRPTRSTAALGAGRLLRRDDALRSALALFGQQGGVRPPGQRLARDLRPADGDHQLLEQLRTVPLSRKAHSADAS